MGRMPRPRGYKRHVIEAIFNDRWDSSTGKLSKLEVTLHEISKYIRRHNRKTGGKNSDRNAANFFKDFIRNRRSFNRNWPSSVFERGYTGRQVTGDELSFEFVPVRPGQAEPYLDSGIPLPSSDTPDHLVESLSLPLASRRLGRRDEAWLTQVLVRLRVIETHFATQSARKVLHIDHLQMNIKQKGSEIDAVYLGIEKNGNGEMREVIVSCEAKGVRDDILESQIVKQVKTIFSMRTVTQDLVVPLAVKVIGPSRIQIVEFEAVRRENADKLDALVSATSAVFEFKPQVEGIR